MSKRTPIVVGTRFTTKKRLNKLKRDNPNVALPKKLDYISRTEAIGNRGDIFIDDGGYLTRDSAVNKTNIKVLSHDQVGLEQILYFDKCGPVYSSNLLKRQDNISKLESIEENEKMCLYENFISLGADLEAELIGKFTQEELYEKVKTEFEKFAIKNDFDIDTLEYFIALHSNTENFHIHVDFFETNPTREKNKLDVKSFEYFKKNLTLTLSESIQNEYSEILKQIEEDKEERIGIVDSINVLKKLDEIGYSKLEIQKVELSIKNGTQPYYNSIKDENVKKAIDDVYNSFEFSFSSIEELKKINNTILGDTQSFEHSQFTREENRIKNHLFTQLKIETLTEDKGMEESKYFRKQSKYLAYEIVNSARKRQRMVDKAVQEANKNIYGK